MALLNIIIILPIIALFRFVVYYYLSENNISLKIHKLHNTSTEQKTINYFFFFLYPIIIFYLFFIGYNNNGFILRTILIAIFLSLGLIDWFTLKLPDLLHGFAFVLISLVIYTDELIWINKLIGLLGALIFGLLILLISNLVYKKNVFGIGDVKLMCVIGYLSGLNDFFYIFFLGVFISTIYALTGIVLKKLEWKSKIALGSFLSTAAILYTLFSKNEMIFHYIS